ncbi:aminopeptidase [Paenibacillus chartarius]|uniref:Aminopeptidase n=1 Tax=Paenibacillus chartarius TaxID=747481 RepID=A0ABV6DQP0_9BACL
MTTFEQHLDRYAELVVKVGANVQPGQLLIVESPLENAPLTRRIVRKAYEAGAKFVQVLWDDEAVTRIRYESAPDESFDYYPEWTARTMEMLAESGGALLHIKVPDPNLFEGIDAWKITAASKAALTARQTYSSYVRTNKFSWCLIKAPTAAWAAKVMPEVPEPERLPSMWDAIFRMNRVYEADPIAAWQAHIDKLTKLQTFLNEKRYKSLHYQAPGTDLQVELADGHIWIGGGDLNESGIYFVPNMPTEEVFTMPCRTGVNGTVSSTLPLNLNGRIIDKFSLTFRDGKVVGHTAEVGLDALTRLLDMDEGMRFLGEVALVPHDSPISKMGRIFYNTGIDENASCHFALGSAYPVNIEGGVGLSKEELLARGGNVSLNHVDFMIGSAELNITGELQDGSKEPIFTSGSWAIRFEE